MNRIGVEGAQEENGGGGGGGGYRVETEGEKGVSET